MNSYSHRNAVKDDLPAIVEIYNSTIASRQVTSDTEPVSVASKEAWFDGHTPDHRPLWVVEYEGKIMGWISLTTFYGRPAYDGTVEVSIYIHEDARGKGIGRYLMNEMIRFAPSIKIHTLLAFIYAHNPPSLQLFKAFDFEQWGYMPNVCILDGIGRDVVILGKQIASLHSL